NSQEIFLKLHNTPQYITVQTLTAGSTLRSAAKLSLDDIARAGALGQRNDVLRDRLHHAPGFFCVFITIVDLGDAALLMVRHAVHCVAAEAEFGDLRGKGATQVVRSCARGPELGADVTHLAVNAQSTIAVEKFIEQCQHRLRQPDTMACTVFRARPVELRYGFTRQLPPAIADMLAPHFSDLSRPLA